MERLQRLEQLIEDLGSKVDQNGRRSDMRHDEATREMRELKSYVRNEVGLLRTEVDGLKKVYLDIADAQAAHAKMLTDHARMHTEHMQSVAAVRDIAREAMQSSSDIEFKQRDFQEAVQRHLTATYSALATDVADLKGDNVIQNDNIRALQETAVETKQTADATKKQSDAIFNELGLQPDGKRTKLATISRENKGSIIVTTITLLTVLAKVLHEILQRH